MKTIGIIGATGQVGTELCLTLSRMPDVRVIAIGRSRLACALLELCGIECRTGSLADRAQARIMLAGCDLVFDLSLPRGLVSEIRSASLKVIGNAVAESPAQSVYVFASTYMALGMSLPGERFADRWFSKTSYGANKRLMERAAFGWGRKCGKQVFALRLGQVHGELQSVSHLAKSFVSTKRVLVPRGPSNTVFVFTIAETLVNIALGKETPGLYMMTSNPQWTWKDLHRYFASKAGIQQEITEMSSEPVRWSPLSKMKSLVIQFLSGNREFLTGYVLWRFSKLEKRAKAQHLIRSARAQLGQAELLLDRPYDGAFSGEAPGARLKCTSDSRQTMSATVLKVRQLLDSIRTDENYRPCP